MAFNPPVPTLPEDYPPVPSLPPASELRRYGSSPPDIFSPYRRYHANEEAMKFVYDAMRELSAEQKLSLLRQALGIFPFCVEALNCWAEIFLYSFDPPSHERAEETYKLGISASRLLWPDLPEQNLLSSLCSGHAKKNRPFLRVYFGLGIVQYFQGKFDDAEDIFHFLLAVNRSDDQGVRIFLLWTLLTKRDFEYVEAIEKSTGERTFDNAILCYDYLLVDYVKFMAGVCTEAKLKDTLVRALTHNLFLPAMLRGDLRGDMELHDAYSPGSRNEAIRIMYRTMFAWKNYPGLDWLRRLQHLGGKKPNDDGTILFQLLQKGTILVKKKNSNHLWRLTTKVDQMSGKEKPDFCLAPGMKEHNPVKIVAFDCDKAFEKDGSFLENFTSFSYDDVAEIPFWKILYKSKVFGKVKQDCSACCKQTGTLACSVCKVAHYCSRTCQKKDWRAGHKAQCPKFIKS